MNWLALLRDAVKATSVTAVAAELGLANHTAVSLVLNGKYPAKTDRIADRVMLRYGHVECPFLEKQITFAECREFHGAEAPTSSQFDLRHWKACQGCANNTLRRST